MTLSELRDLLDQLENQGAAQEILNQTFENVFEESVFPAQRQEEIQRPVMVAESRLEHFDDQEAKANNCRSSVREPRESLWATDRASWNALSARSEKLKSRNDRRCR